MDFDFKTQPTLEDIKTRYRYYMLLVCFNLKSNFCPSTLLDLHSEEVELAGPAQASPGPCGEPPTWRPEVVPLRDLLGGQQAAPHHYS